MLHHLDDNLSPFDNLSVLPSLPVKQLEIRLTVFVGHSEKKKKKITYLIFTVMMSILFLSVLVSQHVNLDALLIAERW